MNKFRSFYTAPLLRPCAGVMCDKHGQCVRYAHVDGTDVPSMHWLARCQVAGTDDYAAFVHVKFIGPPSRAQYFMTRKSLRRVAVLPELEAA